MRRAAARDGGAVALEAVLVLPLVALLLVAVLGTLAVVTDQLAVTRAARAAARTVALTGDAAGGRGVAVATAPGALVDVRVAGRVVRVEVRLDQRLLGVPYSVGASSSAPLEPAVR